MKKVSYFSELYDEKTRLENDKLILKSEVDRLKGLVNNLNWQNAELANKLKSKRYFVTDCFVDTAYKLLKKKTKKQLLIENRVVLPEDRESKGDMDSDTTVRERDVRKIVKNKVSIINFNFYDWDGKIVYKGGAERYVYDLACILKEMGFSPQILQCSNVPFKKKFRGIDVIGVGKGDRYDVREDSKIFNYYCSDCEFVIASPFKLACEIKNIPVIGINHGVDFDADWNRNYYNYDDRNRDLVDALKNVRKCVCVDTNFINWTRSIDYVLSMKEEYIPNYYDEKSFGMNCEKEKDSDKVVFVYPRRIYEARGADITIRAFKRLLPKYKDRVSVRFVGQFESGRCEKALKDLMDKFPDNVERVEYDMRDMVKAYEGADVALIPTRYCEGTSLSCIESMAMGCAVIATNVGGLPNLVIDGYNGLLISPTTDDLSDAIEKLINNKGTINIMGKNGHNICVNAFTKNVWTERWKKVINDIVLNIRK